MKHMPKKAFATARPAVHAAYASPELVAMIERINANFETFKAENDSRLKAVEKGNADPLTEEKVNKINTQLTADIKAMQAEMANLAEIRASLAQGGGAASPMNAAQREHTQAFEDWFRRGTGADALNDLAVKAALTSSSNVDGGYLVPDQIESAIDRVLAQTSAMRRICRVIPVGSATYSKMINIGGASSGWTNDKRSKSETNTPKLEKYSFPVHEIYANPTVDNSTLDDSIIDIAEWLSGEVDIEFSRAESDGFINGDGDGMPRGLVGGYTYVANTTRKAGELGFVASGHASQLNNADVLISLFHALKGGYRNGALWLMNDLTVADVRKLKNPDGDYIWQTDFSSDQPFTLLGKPIETDDFMPTVAANALAVAFGNFKAGYLITDRKQTTVLRDPYSTKGKTSFYTTKRVGGGVQNFEAIKFLKIAA